MKTRFTPILLAMTIAFTACGSKVDSSVTTLKEPVKVDEFAGGNPADIKNAAFQGVLSCAFAGECEPALALISVSTDHGLSRCSGFLISATEVMTNDHCLAGSLGDDAIFVHFADLNPDANSKLTFGLKSVKVRSGGNGVVRQDYALLELSEPVLDRAPLKISARGFNDLEAAHIFRVQMTNNGSQGGYGGLQNRLDCQASYRTFLYPAVNSAKAKLMTFGDCAIQLGNSGSPIFNSDGEVGTILQGYLLPENNTKLNDDLAAISLDSVYGQVAIGTVLYCIDHPDCDAIGSLKTQMPYDFLNAQILAHAPSLEKQDDAHQWLKLKTSAQAGSEIFVSAPVCENANAFVAETSSVRAGLNRFMQFEWRRSELHTSVHFNRSTVSLLFSAEIIGGTLTVPRCK